jgi:hypothetical protein
MLFLNILVSIANKELMNLNFSLVKSPPGPVLIPAGPGQNNFLQKFGQIQRAVQDPRTRFPAWILHRKPVLKQAIRQ